MGGEPSLRLSDLEKRQIGSLLASEPPSSRRAIRLKIILELADGKKKKDVAEDCGVCPKTVWKTECHFLIFRIDGILDDAPRIGIKHIIFGERADEILEYLLLNNPTESTRWTGTELAHSLNLKKSTVYNILNEWWIKLDDPRTIQEACSEDGFDPADVVGLFISPSVSVMAFSCGDGRSPDLTGVVKFTASVPGRNVSSFYHSKCDSVIGLAEEVRTLASSRRERGFDPTDVSRFLRLIDREIGERKGILLATGSGASKAFKRVECFCAVDPRLRLVVAQDGWPEMLRRELLRPGMSNMNLAMRLEGLEGHLNEWLSGSGRKIGTFAWWTSKK